MKQISKMMLALLVFATTAFSQSAFAQDISKEMAGLAKKFTEAYNSKNGKDLKEMFTKDAVRVNPDGTSVTGNEAIVQLLSTNMADDVKLEVMTDKVTQAADGTITSAGTYKVTGKSKAGEAIDLKGAYTNTVVKDDGKWKISKQVLTNL